MRFSPAQGVLLRRLQAGPIRARGPLDNLPSRRGLEQRGLTLETEGMVHLSPKGRDLFGAAFSHVVCSLAAIQAPHQESDGSLLWSPVPALAIPTTFRLFWAKNRGEIHLFQRRGNTESLLWTLTDLVDPADLVLRLKRSGVLFQHKKSRDESAEAG